MVRLLRTGAIALLVVVLLQNPFALADDSSLKAEVGILEKAEVFSMDACDDYIVFIYQENESWVVEQFGNYNWVDNRAYVVNLKDNEIRLLSTEPVKLICDTPKAVFYVTESDKIVYTDYCGKVSKTVYLSSTGEIECVSRYMSKMCFTEGEYIMLLDLFTFEISTVAHHKSVSSVHMIDESKIVWRDGITSQINLLDLMTKKSSQISELEYNELTSVTVTEPLDIETSELGITGLSTSQEDFPFNDFPSNSSYFTKNGSACTDHHVKYNGDYHISSSCNCRGYGGVGYQCMGFAYYASDRYAHINGTATYRPATSSSDRLSDRSITSTTQLRNYFSSLAKGAYVRYEGVTETGDPKGHSIVVVLASASGVYVYDCNLNGRCDVQYRFITYQYILDNYLYLVDAFSHNYVANPQAVSVFAHRVFCDGSGCTAYVIQPHSYSEENTEACEVCGY